MYKKLIFILALLFVAGCTQSANVSTFEECVEAGNPILESFPERCIHDGVEYINDASLALNCETKQETFCPSTNECVTVWNNYCEEFSEFYIEPSICTREYNPVCGVMQIPRMGEESEFVRVTFSNPCEAQAYNAFEVLPGTCEEQIISDDKFEVCENLGGTALPEFNECEYISESSCDLLGGEFFECESACRNSPDFPDVACTMQCVLVCKFN